MKFCYADPPYPGMAEKFYSHDPRCAEVDHGKLMLDLDEQYPAWALSTATTTLRDVLVVAPAGVRVGAWVKPFASFKPGVNPAYTWEPVLFKTPNRSDRGQTTRDHVIADAVACNITLRRGLTGAKPRAFCFWLFDLLGASPDDEFVDLFPGTGGVMCAWEQWREIRGGAVVTLDLFAEATP